MNNSNHNKNLIASLIPMGMMIGCVIGVNISLFFKPEFLVFSVGIGTGIGFLISVVIYGYYSKKENS